MPEKTYECAIQEAQNALLEAKELLREELQAYPTPISGCDQQYIRLIADRTRISRTIQTLSNLPFVATPRVMEAD